MVLVLRASRALLEVIVSHGENIPRLIGQGHIDPLTGINNRRFLQEAGGRAMSLARRHRTFFSVVGIDVDGLKETNDGYGHLVGDEVLKKVARILKVCSREGDVVARYGGDEFVVILPATDKSGAARFVQRIREAIDKIEIEIPDLAEKITASISCGIATWEDGREFFEELLEEADGEMYRDKREKKGLGPRA